jgi:hypothetical protein
LLYLHQRTLNKRYREYGHGHSHTGPAFFAEAFAHQAKSVKVSLVPEQFAGEFSMRYFAVLSMALFCLTWHVSAATPQEPAPPKAEAAQKLSLKQAVMCERVENLTPVGPGLVFSVSAGQVCCYTSFDPVPQHTVIYHRWFRRDELSTQTRLRMYPAKWSTYSVIQLRETDKGPWRVEIIDQNGRVFDVLRFSIVD